MNYGGLRNNILGFFLFKKQVTTLTEKYRFRWDLENRIDRHYNF